jgi:hypothetical protein
MARPPVHCSCNQLFDDLYSVGDATEKLQKAYRNGHRLMRDLLIKRGAVINDDDAFVAACKGGLQDSVESLLRRGVKANTTGALQKASAGGFAEIVRILINEGVDVEATDDQGLTTRD